MMSWVGIAGAFQPIVFDSFRDTTSLMLLSRRRADIVGPSTSSEDECNETGKLNLRFVSGDNITLLIIVLGGGIVLRVFTT